MPIHIRMLHVSNSYPEKREDEILIPQSPYAPFGALIKVDLRLACGVAATVEVSPVKRIVTQAVKFCLVLKRAFYFRAAFSTIFA